jgi:ribonuclease HII
MQLPLCLPEHQDRLIAGVDEAGRGPLAGAVFAAAVIPDPGRQVRGVTDSKKLNAEQREELYEQIIESSLCYAVASASTSEIDDINILQASLLAMHRAVKLLSISPEFIYVDGLYCPRWPYASLALVKGDSRISAIAAASILAKVSRDREMIKLDAKYPNYGFAQHKGYPTPLHIQTLQKFGPCDIHRKSFKPVADWEQLSTAELLTVQSD